MYWYCISCRFPSGRYRFDSHTGKWYVNIEVTEAINENLQQSDSESVALPSASSSETSTRPLSTLKQKKKTKSVCQYNIPKVAWIELDPVSFSSAFPAIKASVSFHCAIVVYGF